MKFYKFTLLIVLLCISLFDASNQNCDAIVNSAKKLCKHYPVDYQRTCMSRRLKRTSCNNIGCQDNCENIDCNYGNVGCLQFCTKCKEETPNLSTQNISTTLNIHNVVENHNKIENPVTVHSSMHNVVIANNTEKKLCCQIWVPNCSRFYYPNGCRLQIQERCGKICEEAIFKGAGYPLYPYYGYQPYFYPFTTYPKYCQSQIPYMGCNKDYSHLWYYNYYNWKIYNDYLWKMKNSNETMDRDAAIINDSEKQVPTLVDETNEEK